MLLPVYTCTGQVLTWCTCALDVLCFYQPGAREARARLVLRLLYVPVFVCVCVFVHNYHVR